MLIIYAGHHDSLQKNKHSFLSCFATKKAPCVFTMQGPRKLKIDVLIFVFRWDNISIVITLGGICVGYCNYSEGNMYWVLSIL